MDRLVLLLATALAAVGGVLGWWSMKRGTRNRWTTVCMVFAFIAQFYVLGIRGEMRGQCPLGDAGEILLFLSWSLTMFYLLVGPAYRVTLLGLFTTPIVVISQLLALIPGMMTSNPERVTEVNPWREAHTAFSVLSYGAFGLATVAAIMFLILNKSLKNQDASSKLFKRLPSVNNLGKSIHRLVWIGFVILTVGITCGIAMGSADSLAHLIAATLIWVLYGVILGVKWKMGMTGKTMATSVSLLFIGSLLVFAFI